MFFRPAVILGEVVEAKNLSVSRGNFSPSFYLIFFLASFYSAGTCDPFVKVSYFDAESSRGKTSVHRTESISSTSSPVWQDFQFRLRVEPPENDDGLIDWTLMDGALIFDVYDENEGTVNELLGHVRFMILNFFCRF